MKTADGFNILDQIIELKNAEKLDTILDFNEFFKENAKVEIVSNYYNEKIVLSFEYNGIKYFWKYDKNYPPYNDLIVNELAKDLGLQTVDYDLASIGNLKGSISKNYKVANAKYIKGITILEKYYKVTRTNSHNSLESIMLALEKNYANNPNMQEIVEKLMQKLIKTFVLDIFTGQIDKHSENWEIVEYVDGSVDLSPLYDSTRIMSLYYRPSIARLAFTVDDNSPYLENNIKTFLKSSRSEFSQLLYDFIWIISKENLLKIFNRIELKIESKIPTVLKNTYLTKFGEQEEFIMQILENFKKGIGK